MINVTFVALSMMAFDIPQLVPSVIFFIKIHLGISACCNAYTEFKSIWTKVRYLKYAKDFSFF